MLTPVDISEGPSQPALPPSGAESANKMTFAEKVQIADIVIKAVGSVLLLVSGWMAVLKYFEDQEAARFAAEETRKRADESKVNELAAEVKRAKESEERQKADYDLRIKEFQLRLFEHKVARYSEICEAVARIAVADRLDDVREEMRNFSHLYWGKICIFESEPVEKAQVKIQYALSHVTNGNSPPPKELRSLSIALAHACRDDLNDAFLRPKMERKERPPEQISPLLLKPPGNPSKDFLKPSTGK